MDIGKESLYIIRAGSEITTKSKRVRLRLWRQLATNIHWAITTADRHATVRPLWDRIEVRTTYPHTEDILGRVFGVKVFYRTEKIKVQILEDLLTRAEEHFKDYVQNKLFAVRAKVRGNAPFTSREVEVHLGARLLPYARGVNLSDPEITCYVEVKDKEALLYSQRKEGVGGFPLGVGGRVVHLFSGGIDSPVATWYLWRSGVQLHFVYFDLGSKEQKASAINTLRHLVENWGYGATGKLIVVPFGNIVAELLKQPKRFQTLLLKWFFYRVAEELALTHRLHAISTGESLGQVSTQTLANLLALDGCVRVSILRPLLTFDRETIIAHARKIGTYEHAYKGPEYCGLANQKVETAATAYQLMSAALHCSPKLIPDAIANATQYDIRHLPAPQPATTDIPIPENAIIVDLRPPPEFAKYHIPNSRNIPFEIAWTDFHNWDRNAEYLLVCAEGVLSALLEHHMKQEGFKVSHLEGGIVRWLTRQKKISPAGET